MTFLVLYLVDIKEGKDPKCNKQIIRSHCIPNTGENEFDSNKQVEHTYGFLFYSSDIISYTMKCL